MVVKRNLDRRVDGLQVTFVPKGPRSARRSPFKKTVKESQTSAFELLASLAGRLLLEGESSSASSNACEEKEWSTFSKINGRQEGHEEDEPLQIESIYQVSYGDFTSKPEVASQDVDDQKNQHSEGKSVSKDDETASNSSNYMEKAGSDVKFENCLTENSPVDYGRVALADASLIGESSAVDAEKKLMHQEEARRSLSGELTAVDKCTLVEATKLCDKLPVMIDSNSDFKEPYLLESYPSTFFCRHVDNVKLDCRDDDERNSRFNKFSMRCKPYRRPQRISHRRIRKLLTSKYWKLAPKSKDYDLSNSDMGVKPLYRKRKACDDFEAFHHNSVFKRMKVSEHSSAVNSDGGFSSGSVSNSLEKGKLTDKNGVTPLASSAYGHRASSHKSSHVKLSIKSFKVPELYVEVPETTTVGSLKKTVMEAVMAILGGGLHVGLLVHGKKIRDDNKTLRQTGIVCKENLDSLGFTLESSSVPALHPVPSVDLTPLSSSETSHALTGSPGNTGVESEITDCTTDSSLLTKPANLIETSDEPPLSQADVKFDKVGPNSRALVIVPERNTDPLALVPVSLKNRRSELAQRRTRRPFSVYEVEALVHAVEELGTGRWRDVKLRAFVNVDHRTYVDLKDKWKTLVHTAKISPQQRRGEPVPQVLLDKVLAAHAYWSQHQARQNVKHQTGTLKTADSTSEDAVGGSIPQVVS